METTLGVRFNAIFLICFQMTNNPNILIFLRGLHGFMQMIPSIYVPVRINQFSIRKYRTIQITSLQLFQTTGKCIGYFHVILIGKLEIWIYSWRSIFIILLNLLLNFKWRLFQQNLIYAQIIWWIRKKSKNFLYSLWRTSS